MDVRLGLAVVIVVAALEAGLLPAPIPQPLLQLLGRHFELGSELGSDSLERTILRHEGRRLALGFPIPTRCVGLADPLGELMPVQPGTFPQLLNTMLD